MNEHLCVTRMKTIEEGQRSNDKVRSELEHCNNAARREKNEMDVVLGEMLQQEHELILYNQRNWNTL